LLTDFLLLQLRLSMAMRADDPAVPNLVV
jgi:hypothetical protein